jgi:hypothetical protein
MTALRIPKTTRPHGVNLWQMNYLGMNELQCCQFILTRQVGTMLRDLLRS